MIGEAQPNTTELLHNRLLRILELTQKLAQPHDLSGMLKQVLEAGLNVLQAESGSLWLYDASKNVINMHLPVLASPISVSVGQGLVGECLATNRVINVRDCYADPRFNSSVDKETGFKTRSLLSVPLVGADEAQVGVLQLLNKRGGPFDEEDERIAVTLAAQSAVALQRAQATALIAFPDLSVSTNDCLHNLDLGDWSGKRKKDIQRDFPGDWEQWIHDPHAIRFPRGESLKDVHQRARRFLRWFQESAAAPMAAVTHRSVIKCLLGAALGLDTDYFWKFHLDNGSVTQLVWESGRGFTLTALNDTSPLPHLVTEWY